MTNYVLFLGKSNAEYNKRIEDIARKHKFVLMTAYQMCTMIELASLYPFKILIIDGENFFVDEDFLQLFTHRLHFVPNVLVLDNKIRNFTSSHIICCNKDDENLDNLILETVNNKDSALAELSVPFFLKAINELLMGLGFNPKYKGYRYLGDIIYRMMKCEPVTYSFDKNLYPYIAKMYNVTKDSVERSLRNILKIAIKQEDIKEKIQFPSNRRQTTRNILHCLVRYCENKQIG